MKLLQAVLVSLFLAVASLSVQAESVDINSADAMKISKVLKGIGLQKAKAIVAYRDKHGNFKKVDDLAKVKGIGKKTVALNRASLSVGKAKK